MEESRFESVSNDFKVPGVVFWLDLDFYLLVRGTLGGGSGSLGSLLLDLGCHSDGDSLKVSDRDLG